MKWGHTWGRVRDTRIYPQSPSPSKCTYSNNCLVHPPQLESGIRMQKKIFWGVCGANYKSPLESPGVPKPSVMYECGKKHLFCIVKSTRLTERGRKREYDDRMLCVHIIYLTSSSPENSKKFCHLSSLQKNLMQEKIHFVSRVNSYHTNKKNAA